MPETTQLLLRWQNGEDAALEEILRLHLPWVRRHVRERLGTELREKLATEDVVQEAMVDFLRNGPRFVPANTNQLRALLARIVGNALSDQSHWFRAARRRMSNETSIASSAELAASDPDGQPADAAIAREQTVRLRLAMELLAERDRHLLVWREWEKLPFAEIGVRLAIDAEAARAAYRRAFERLRDTMTQLRLGDVEAAVASASA